MARRFRDPVIIIGAGAAGMMAAAAAAETARTAGRPAEKTDKGGCGRIPFCFDIRRKMCYTFPVLA